MNPHEEYAGLDMREGETHLQLIRRVLGSERGRYFKVGDACHQTGHAVESRTPLDELIEKEESGREAALMVSINLAQKVLDLDVVPEPLQATIANIVEEAWRQNEEGWLDWLFEEGPDPLIVMKRLFALAKNKRPHLVWKMGFRALGALFKETHAAFAARCAVLFGSDDDKRAVLPTLYEERDRITRRIEAIRSGSSVKIAKGLPEWRKPVEARLAMQKAQLGNANRKGGKKVLNSQC